MIHTNYSIFYEIALDAYENMVADLKKNIAPKPDASPGFIKTIDWAQTSFKNAFIIITFCGSFLEAFLHILIVKKHGLSTYNKNDKKNYEDKLKLLGCNCKSLFDQSKRFRLNRREVMHEKAYKETTDFKIAQDVAQETMNFVQDVIDYLDDEFDIRKNLRKSTAYN
jgi:rhamnose utilization protein RhaD (predicted bifunctional aldolase and dehydrogenase)